MTCKLCHDPEFTSVRLQEMVDLMGGSDSAAFAEYEDLCVLAFLAVPAPAAQLHPVNTKKRVDCCNRFCSRFACE